MRIWDFFPRSKNESKDKPPKQQNMQIAIDYSSPLPDGKCKDFVLACQRWEGPRNSKYLVKYPWSFQICTVESTLESLAKSAEYSFRKGLQQQELDNALVG